MSIGVWARMCEHVCVCMDSACALQDAARAFGYWNKTMRFPNALFFFNVNDHPKNGPEYHHPGPVPILSLSKYVRRLFM